MAEQQPRLDLVEPTLFDQTGHGYSYNLALLNANTDFNFEINIWLDKRTTSLFDNKKIKTLPFFYRPLRQIQKFFLYKKLLNTSGVLYISTAELWDLQLLVFLRKFLKNSKKIIVLHFHQFKKTSKKISKLQELSQTANFINIVTPTKKLSQIFIQAGFNNTHIIACPSYAPKDTSANKSTNFSKVLYAGAARGDKGFTHVINSIEYNQKNNSDIKFELQISKPNSCRYDNETSLAIEKLRSLSKNNLILHEHTLSQEQYQSLFDNAICLLLYRQQDYADKFSGVALDAIYANCPIITTKNTWIGDTVDEHKVGVTIEHISTQSVQEAIETIKNNFDYYSENTKIAANKLKVAHNPKNTLALLKTLLP